jgi:hypothetical protein
LSRAEVFDGGELLCVCGAGGLEGCFAGFDLLGGEDPVPISGADFFDRDAVVVGEGLEVIWDVCQGIDW